MRTHVGQDGILRGVGNPAMRAQTESGGRVKYRAVKYPEAAPAAIRHILYSGRILKIQEVT
jgi:hypothetical protein